MKKFKSIILSRWRKIIWVMVLIFVIPLLAWAKDINNEVVKIYTVYNTHSYSEPWQTMGQESASGSGCIISGKRILTNAHVVSDQTFIQVQKAGEVKKYTAQ